MQFRMKCEKPEDIVYTMTVTASAKEWEALREQLKDSYPSWNLTSAINDLLAQARKVYWPKEDAA